MLLKPNKKMTRKNKPTLDHSDIKRICKSFIWAVFLIAFAYNPKAFWSVVFFILALLCVLIEGKITPEIYKFQL